MDLSALNEIIYKRLSHRKYKKGAIGEKRREALLTAFSEVKPLYPGIRTELKLLSRDEVRSMMLWMPSDAVAIYSEECVGYLENAGFILQQIDLFAQSIGLGTCWVGLAKPKGGATNDDGLGFVILLAIGESEVPLRSGESDFKRKEYSDISSLGEEMEQVLLPARLAPSSINSQPWYFSGSPEEIDVYQLNLVRTRGLTRMNRIDVGIALAHLYVANPGSFSASVKENPPQRDGATYVTSLKI